MDFTSLGFTFYDLVLLAACSFGGVVGSFAHGLVASISLDGPPNVEGVEHFASPKLQEARGAWLAMRLMLGAILGFVFGLYFVGMLNDSPSSFARVWALSFLVGYAAPKIWIAQEEFLMRKLRAEGSAP